MDNEHLIAVVKLIPELEVTEWWMLICGYVAICPILQQLSQVFE